MNEKSKKIASIIQEINKIDSSLKTTEIYNLETTDEISSKYNILNGNESKLPIEWPKTSFGKDMDFLFMLDLNTMPELKNQYAKYEAIAFFIEKDEDWNCGDREISEDDYETEDFDEDEEDFDEYDEYDSGFEQQQTQIIFFTKEELEKSTIKGKSGFNVVSFKVPEIIFGNPNAEYFDSEKEFKGISEPLKTKLDELRKKVYGLNARVGGNPQWLQYNEGGANSFIMQFDEGFADVNLGDCGLMYVYSDDAFWQCH